MRVSFQQIFQTNPDGSYSPKGLVRVGSATMSPGVSFGSGVTFSGFNIATYAGHDLEIEQNLDGAIEIKGAY